MQIGFFAIVCYALFQIIAYLFINIEIISYSISIALSCLLIAVFIHLEQGISNEVKFKLKDKYSHDLAQLQQVVLGNIDLAVFNLQDDPEVFNVVPQAKSAAIESQSLIEHIREL